MNFGRSVPKAFGSGARGRLLVVVRTDGAPTVPKCPSPRTQLQNATPAPHRCARQRPGARGGAAVVVVADPTFVCAAMRTVNAYVFICSAGATGA